MELVTHAIARLIDVSESEIKQLSCSFYQKRFRKLETIARAGNVSNEVLFIEKGVLRKYLLNDKGQEYTVHFAMEGQFIADYASYLTGKPAGYNIQALEAMQVTVLPRVAIEWGYQNLAFGDRLGRLIAEFYFVQMDQRISDLYTRTPKEIYDSITQIFPNIHNRVPQHMIASYIGITPVHLSRLKKGDYSKV